MPDPLMGFTLQSFTPSVQPYTVSDTFTLMSLGLHRFPLRHDPTQPTSHPRTIHQFSRKRRGPCATPVFRVLLCTKVCHLPWRFRPNQAHSSPGASSPSGFSPSPQVTQPSSCLPSCGYQEKMQALFLDPLQGFHSKRDWLVFFKTAYPLGVYHLLILHSCLTQ